MQPVQVNAFQLTGYSVRTSNLEEMQPATAKIGDLWAQFYSQQGAKLTKQSNIYGVYTDYESDFSGQYRVFSATDTPINDDQLSSLTIAPGLYYVFSTQGEVPNAIIELWGHIWEYFSNDQDARYQRAYTTDFEHYKSPSSFDIYVAVKEK